MNVKTISLARTINLGNYNSLKLELTAELDEGDKASEVVSRLDKFIKREAENLK